MNSREIDVAENSPRKSIKCPFCGSDHLTYLLVKSEIGRAGEYYFHCEKCKNVFVLTPEQLKAELNQTVQKEKIIQKLAPTQDKIAQKLDTIISLLEKLILDDELKKKLEFLIEKEYSNRNKLKRTLTEDSNCARD